MKVKRFAKPAMLVMLSFTSLWSTIAGAETNIVTSQKLNWETAEKLAAEAVRTCTAQGYDVAASVVDSSGQQQAFLRGNNAPFQTISVAYRKAYTAFSYGKTFNKNTTSELIAAKVIGPADGAVLASEPEVLFVAGGVTLRNPDGYVLGGIGVSGAPGGDKDEACAKSAVEKYSDDLK